MATRFDTGRHINGTEPEKNGHSDSY